jgi:hypothetical protein
MVIMPWSILHPNRQNEDLRHEGNSDLPKSFQKFQSLDTAFESRPDQRINIVDGLFSAQMTFDIPGPRCTLGVSH